MRKGVAVPYIIAILLGVAVIGLVGYWFFLTGGKLGTTSSEANCQSDLLTFCNNILSGQTQTSQWITWFPTNNCRNVVDASNNPKYKLTATDSDVRNYCSSIGVSIASKQTSTPSNPPSSGP